MLNVAVFSQLSLIATVRRLVDFSLRALPRARPSRVSYGRSPGGNEGMTKCMTVPETHLSPQF